MLHFQIHLSVFHHGYVHNFQPRLLKKQTLLLQENIFSHFPAEKQLLMRYRTLKQGYVPASQNSLLSLLAFYGHAEILEARILQVKPDADPWEQVRIGVFVKDAREL